MTTVSEEKEKVCIGIPCFAGVTYEVLSDYMRFAYHLGRRNQQYDFYLAVKGKSEQFRARNAIVESAIATGCDWLFMLDDDHVIDVQKTLGPNDQYDFLSKLIQHLKDDPEKGIVGALYFQRGATCDPVIMWKNPPAYTFYQMSDISRRLQKVDVTGGGAMCINMKVFDKIDSPWFQPELGQGTDIQICEKVRAAGWGVWCDTSIELGHIMTDREIVTSKNAQKIRVEASEWMNREDIRQAPALKTYNYTDEYQRDVEEYTGRDQATLSAMREEYNDRFFHYFDPENTEEYYRNLGIYQIARNSGYHSLENVTQEGLVILSLFNPNIQAKGLDFGCGTAPIGFELAMRGHTVDFVDIPGSEAERFVKWRCEKYAMTDRCGFELSEGYDWVLLLDSIEHLHPLKARGILTDIIDRIAPGGSIVTNYWSNHDFANPEHICMRHSDIKQVLEDAGMTMMPIVKGQHMIKNYRWVKGSSE